VPLFGLGVFGFPLRRGRGQGAAFGARGAIRLPRAHRDARDEKECDHRRSRQSRAMLAREFLHAIRRARRRGQHWFA
jgi:hypothetical protein